DKIIFSKDNKESFITSEEFFSFSSISPVSSTIFLVSFDIPSIKRLILCKIYFYYVNLKVFFHFSNNLLKISNNYDILLIGFCAKFN
ncbi:hypothetical protein, partial [uncultured Clostridium sp.]